MTNPSPKNDNGPRSAFVSLMLMHACPPLGGLPGANWRGRASPAFPMTMHAPWLLQDDLPCKHARIRVDEPSLSCMNQMQHANRMAGALFRPYLSQVVLHADRLVAAYLHASLCKQLRILLSSARVTLPPPLIHMGSSACCHSCASLLSHIAF